MKFTRSLSFLLAGAVALLVASACATPGAERRAEEWRSILAAEAPIGAPAEAAEAALRRRGIEPSRGTYTTVRDDGTEHSNCPDPKAAVTGREAAGQIGFNTNVVEVTACLDATGKVERHYVEIWIE